DGLGHFRHVIVLDGAGPGRGLGPGLEVPDGDGESAWYLDVGEGRAVPMTPFALPAADWCESFARGLG
ncbi:hypothetical protein, partial [Streptomyces sp. FH025]|uniref:hypothetical protein n=1 Tax=Streptomyces sp. FH025 TaxID=2815937 RepID=UPI001A9F02B1